MTDKPDMIHIRVPPELKEKLTQKARKNRRSINSEAIIAIESYINRDMQKAKEVGNRATLPPEQSIFDFAGCLADKMTPTRAKEVLDEIRDQDYNE